MTWLFRSAPSQGTLPGSGQKSITSNMWWPASPRARRNIAAVARLDAAETSLIADTELLAFIRL
jgi:hypothetical protein